METPSVTPRRRERLLACLAACAVAACFTLLLNAASLRALQRGELTVSILNDHLIDERYYFAMIAKAGMGAPLLGHASYLEHREGSPSASIAPAVQAVIMRATGMTLPSVLLLGDLLYPFLAVLLLAVGLRRVLYGSLVLSSSTAIIIASAIGVYWLRAANPQLPFTLIAAWLAVVCSMPLSAARGLVLRGVLIGALMWVHPVYASFFGAIDGVLLLSEWIRVRSPRQWVRTGALYAIPAAIVVAPRALLSLPPDVAEDTFHRLGIVLMHLPSVPGLQMKLLLLAAVLLAWRYALHRWPSEGTRIAFLLLLGSVLACNQAVIHGHDAVFAAYYPHAARIVLIAVAAMALAAAVPQKLWRHALAVACAVIAVAGFTRSLSVETARVAAEAAAYESSALPQILSWLRAQPGPAVVAAPSGLSERIPYETPHYVLFNEYGWNQPSTDEELAARYALQVTLLPSSMLQDRTYTPVFGGSAGLTASKRRTFCRMLNRFREPDDPCDIQARDLIRHQELLPVVDAAAADIEASMRRFHVSYLILGGAEALPTVLQSTCVTAMAAGEYTVWKCALRPLP